MCIDQQWDINNAVNANIERFLLSALKQARALWRYYSSLLLLYCVSENHYSLHCSFMGKTIV